MPVPYTPEAVKAIRLAVNNGQGIETVREAFGWNSGMFERVCRQHGIKLQRSTLAEIITEMPTIVAEIALRDAAVNFSLPLNLSLRFLTEKNARKISRSKLAGDIIIAAVNRGDLDSYLSPVNARPLRYFTMLPAATYDALCSIVRRPDSRSACSSISALCAAIIDRHFQADRRSARV